MNAMKSAFEKRWKEGESRTGEGRGGSGNVERVERRSSERFEGSVKGYCVQRASTTAHLSSGVAGLFIHR